jgi:hypothetical protein
MMMVKMMMMRIIDGRKLKAVKECYAPIACQSYKLNEN